jgi:hypothetical protein
MQDKGAKCSTCNSPLREEVFTGPHIDGKATLWICSENKLFGGKCRSNTAFFAPNSIEHRPTQR